MSNEVKPVTATPENIATAEIESPVELSENELQGVSAGIIAILAPVTVDAPPELTCRKSGGDQQD